MVQIKTDQGPSAILGPTNTGKTFSAIERMLSYRSGIIGFPLRLLARENYDKVCSRVGSRNVALLTGEEKIIDCPEFWEEVDTLKIYNEEK